MRITTLGPLAVEGRPVRGERLGAVLRELVDARGRAVSVAALVDAVWQGDPPEDSAGAVQALVSRVRRLGLTVDAVPGGYRVPADRVEVDAVAVRVLVDRGRAALRDRDAGGARAAADEARALFPEIPELDGGAGTRLFAEVAALRAEAALAGAGRFDEADLRRLVARVPPDEPAAALLVRVLAAQGRDAEALEVVERLRSELADRYGADPSPVLVQAHLALLRGEFKVAPPQPVATLPRAWQRPATPLIGREPEVAAVLAMLTDVPLVTVVAAGGAGKTRLAAEVARRASGPVRVVELAGLRAPGEVLPAVLAAFGGADTVSAAPGLSLKQRVLSPEERLRALTPELDGLVVLDNCEHLLDAVAKVVMELLAAAPEISVLATSRAPLGLAGEDVHRLAALPDAEALGLLQARARAGGAVPTWDEDRALALCHRLDNLPLALELAAARLRHMPIDDVLAGLADRFGLLDDALRGLPERHASLWAMVDWSRELLADRDREVLQRLAVIPAPFTAALAAEVAGVPDIWRGLAILVEQSLLTLDRGHGGVPRYRMLETVREYGEARLDAAGGREAAMNGLVGWAREQAAQLVAEFRGRTQLDAFARCTAEQDNLSTALRWAITRQDEAAAIDIAAALFHVWSMRGLHVEVGDWAHSLLRTDDPRARLDSVILRGRAAGGPLPHADRLVWACILIAVNAGITGPMRLTALARRAIRTALRERPEQVSPRSAALVSALSEFEMFEVAANLAKAEELVAHPDPYVQGVGLFLRAAVRENGGSPGVSAADCEEAYRRFEQIGEHWGMALTAQAAGQWIGTPREGRSAEWLARSLRQMELIGATQDARSTRILLDVRLAHDGDPDAEHRLRETASSGQADDFDVARAFLGLAHLAFQRARYDESLDHGAGVIRVLDASADPMPHPRLMCRVAVAVLHLWVAEARSAAEDDTDAQAVALLTATRGEALSPHDTQLIGTWALGGAELAAFRGADEAARELWALSARVGANLGSLLPTDGPGWLNAVLGGEEERKQLLAGPTRPPAAIGARIRELMDDLLGG